MLANLLPFLATQSRSAFVGFVIAVVIAFFSVTKSASKLAAHGLLLFVLVGVVLLEWDFVSKTVSARFNERFYRDAVWPHALQASYGDHFFFGSGLVKTSRISVPGSDLPPFNHCHSAYIDALYRTGIVGLVLMLSHLIFVLSHWSRDPRLLPLFLWLFLTCVMSIFDHPGFFWYLEPLWFAYWIPAGLIGALVMGVLATVGGARLVGLDPSQASDAPRASTRRRTSTRKAAAPTWALGSSVIAR
jgi:O-antigen ligase